MHIITVHKSGGWCKPEDVQKIYSACVNAFGSDNFQFTCLTDIPIYNIKCVALIYNFPGWWSKLELFRPNLLKGPTLFMDLDTIPIKDTLLDSLSYLDDNILWGLSDFYHPKTFASGLMYWNPDVIDLSFLCDERALSSSDKKGGDQTFISKLCIRHKQSFDYMNEYVCGIHSYKKDLIKEANGNLLPNTQIVCFHGLPRPSHVARDREWIQQSWKQKGT